MHRLLLVAIGLLLLAARPAHAAVDASSVSHVLLQRTSDGRMILTDRPMPGATTERAWAFASRDAAAQRQEAIDVDSVASDELLIVRSRSWRPPPLRGSAARESR